MATVSDSQLHVLVSGGHDEDGGLREMKKEQRNKRQLPRKCGNDDAIAAQSKGVLTRYAQRVLKTHCLKSKAVQLIFFWNFVVAFAFESLLSTDPDSYLLPAVFGQDVKVSSVNFAANACILLFYPLAGYLADVKFGRYKTVTKSLWFMFFSELCLMASVVVAVMYLFVFGGDSKLNYLFYLLLVAALPVMFGLVLFRANIVQFGIDQLQDSPSDDSVFFIMGYIWTGFGGQALAKVPFVFSDYLCGELGFKLIHGVGAFLVIVLVVLLGLSLCVSDSNPQWFFIDPAARNPYKLVYGVIKFAAKHTSPIRRSAFTYCEDELPSRLDLGKEKYGGPFTTEQVEDVKTLLGILLVLVIFGPTFSLDSGATALSRSTLPFQFNGNCLSDSNSNSIQYNMTVIARAGALVPFFVIILIPVYVFLVQPLLYHYTPGTLKRMGLGAILLTLSTVCSLMIDLFGKSSDTCFLHSGPIDKYHSKVVVNLVVIPNILNAIAYILILSGSYEFICCQSPHAMKGLLIGTLFAIKGFFNLCGILITLLPFTKWTQNNAGSFPSCGFLYYLINIVVGVVVVMLFTTVARGYQYRQRDEPDHTYRYAEEYYDKSYDDSDSTTS